MSARPVLRRGIALLCAHDLVMLAVFVATPSTGSPRRPDAPSLFAFLADRPWAVAALTAVGLLALLRFVRRRADLAAATAVLGIQVLVFEAHTLACGVILAEWHTSGAALLGWTLGLAYARLRSPSARLHRPTTEHFAAEGAAAAFAATYVAAGLSKLMRSGIEWADPRRIWHLIDAHRRVAEVGPGVVAAQHWLQTRVLGDASLAHALGLLTLVIEVGAILMLEGGITRSVVALSLVGLHVSLFTLTGLAAPQAIVFCLLLALPRSPRARGLLGGAIVLLHGALIVANHTPFPKALLVVVLVLGLPWLEALRFLRGSQDTTEQSEDEAPVDRRAAQRAGRIAMGVAILLATLAWVLPVAELMALPTSEPLKVWQRAP